MPPVVVLVQLVLTIACLPRILPISVSPIASLRRRLLLRRRHPRPRPIHPRGCTGRRRHPGSWRSLHAGGHSRSWRTPGPSHPWRRPAHHRRRTHRPLSIRTCHPWSRHLRRRSGRRRHWSSSRRTLPVALRRPLSGGPLHHLPWRPHPWRRCAWRPRHWAGSELPWGWRPERSHSRHRTGRGCVSHGSCRNLRSRLHHPRGRPAHSSRRPCQPWLSLVQRCSRDSTPCGTPHPGTSRGSCGCFRPGLVRWRGPLHRHRNHLLPAQKQQPQRPPLFPLLLSFPLLRRHASQLLAITQHQVHVAIECHELANQLPPVLYRHPHTPVYVQ
uniref:Secreted protein n=1 Tax=Physcomitrium patens TaxID=3218 RepID=A0A2K1KVV7_PHYPA|nr:hypothetical protein PHYPA_004921 [Physcomitrium patens]